MVSDVGWIPGKHTPIQTVFSSHIQQWIIWAKPLWQNTLGANCLHFEDASCTGSVISIHLGKLPIHLYILRFLNICLCQSPQIHLLQTILTATIFCHVILLQISFPVSWEIVSVGTLACCKLQYALPNLYIVGSLWLISLWGSGGCSVSLSVTLSLSALHSLSTQLCLYVHSTWHSVMCHKVIRSGRQILICCFLSNRSGAGRKIAVSIFIEKV